MKDKTSQAFLHRHSSAGFTMIELMIVVAIIGIIAAIGYPSYTQYVNKSRRADGQLALMNAAQTMERCKTTRFSYASCTLPVTNSEEGHYTLALAPGLTASKFTVVATPTGQQADDTDCPSLSIDELGQNLPADCW